MRHTFDTTDDGKTVHAKGGRLQSVGAAQEEDPAKAWRELRDIEDEVCDALLRNTSHIDGSTCFRLLEEVMNGLAAITNAAAHAAMEAAEAAGRR